MTPSTDNDHTIEGDREERTTLYPASNDGRGATSTCNALSWRPPTPPRSPGREDDDIGSSSSGSNNRRKRWRLPSLFSDDGDNRHDDDEKYDGPDESLLLQDESKLTMKHGGLDGMMEMQESRQSSRGSIHTNMRPSNATSTLTQTIQNFIQNSGQDKGTSRSDEEEENHNTYQMMKSQHGRSRSRLNIPKFAKMTGDKGEGDKTSTSSFFYDGMEELEAQYRSQQQREKTRIGARTQQSIFENDDSRYSYFNHESRRTFNERHSLLNADILREEDINSRSIGGDHDSDNSNDDVISDDFDDDDFDDEYHLDFMNLFTFGCTPSARERYRHHHNRQREDELPAISDIRKSSLSYMSNGRIQMRLPGDNVRLVMDKFLEPGILSVEIPPLSLSSPPSSQTICNRTSTNGDHMSDSEKQPTKSNPAYLELGPADHLNLDPAQHELCEDFPDQLVSPSDVRDEWNSDPRLLQQYRKPEPNYLLTVDQDLYKRVLTDLSDSQMSCGLYYCCHDSVDGSKHVNIGVAISILAVVFTCLFVGVYKWPLE